MSPSAWPMMIWVPLSVDSWCFENVYRSAALQTHIDAKRCWLIFNLRSTFAASHKSNVKQFSVVQ